MDLDLEESVESFRTEVRDFLAANRAHFPTESYDTAAGFEQHRQWDKVLFDAGLSVANQPNPVPSVTPSTAGVSRPDLAANMSTAVADLKWPPKPGQYDERGHIITVGELTALASALACEEVRAFIQGFVQSKQPTTAHKVQIYQTANALVSALQHGMHVQIEVIAVIQASS